MDGMVIKVGRETYVMPMPAIVECLRPARGDVQNLIGSRGMLQLRGDLVPLVRLSDLLDVSLAPPDLSIYYATPQPPSPATEEGYSHG